MFKRLLVPLDGSKLSEASLSIAASPGANFGGFGDVVAYY